MDHNYLVTENGQHIATIDMDVGQVPTEIILPNEDVQVVEEVVNDMVIEQAQGQAIDPNVNVAPLEEDPHKGHREHKRSSTLPA